MAEKYGIKMFCGNCGYQWVQDYDKGERVHDPDKCPNCECWDGHQEVTYNG